MKAKEKVPGNGDLFCDLTASWDGGYACRYGLATTVSHSLIHPVNDAWRGHGTTQAFLLIDPLKNARSQGPPSPWGGRRFFQGA